MHLTLISISIILAGLIRLRWRRKNTSWSDRWQHTLIAFLFPPLLLLMTSAAVLQMGHHGTMLQLPVGWLGCHLAMAWLTVAGLSLAYWSWQAWRSLQRVKMYRHVAIAGYPARLLDTSALFAAQVGFWNSELIVSTGLWQQLSTDQLEAVLAHEQAHATYRDTFWFFWLGWIRHLTAWLPNTTALWQELLLLRELRADYRAAQQVDALVLAESLLKVVRSTTINNLSLPSTCAAFDELSSLECLEERISFLLEQPTIEQSHWQVLIGLSLTLLPVLTVLLHHVN